MSKFYMLIGTSCDDPFIYVKPLYGHAADSEEEFLAMLNTGLPEKAKNRILECIENCNRQGCHPEEGPFTTIFQFMKAIVVDFTLDEPYYQLISYPI